MERHFLADAVCGEQRFDPRPRYVPHGDCIVYRLADEAVVANRIDDVLTIYESAIDRRAIGYQIKGVHALVRKFGLDGLAVHTESASGEIQSISIVAILLAAYEDGPKTIWRRAAYTQAFERSPKDHLIPTSELCAQF